MHVFKVQLSLYFSKCYPGFWNLNHHHKTDSDTKTKSLYSQVNSGALLYVKRAVVVMAAAMTAAAAAAAAAAVVPETAWEKPRAAKNGGFYSVRGSRNSKTQGL